MKSQFVLKKMSIFLVLILMLSSCAPQEEIQAEEIRLSVDAVEVKAGEVEAYHSYSSVATPISQVYIIPRVSGTVKTLNVDIGSEVKKGETLFTIDDTDILIALSRAEGAYLAAQAGYAMTTGGDAEQTILRLETELAGVQLQLSDAEKTLERTKELHAIGGVSDKELELAQMALDAVILQYDSIQKTYDLTVNTLLGQAEAASAATLKQARSGYDEARRALENTKVKAEIGGVIGMSNVTRDNTVAAGQPVMSIVDMSQILFEFAVPDSVVSTLTAGSSEVWVEISALSGERFSGVIEALSPVANEQSRLYPVKVVIDNERGLIKPGMFATIKLVTNREVDVINIPISSILEEEGKQYVFVVGEESKAEKRFIETSLAGEANIVVTSGLSAGERIVTRGQNMLSEGSLVNVVG